MKYRLSLVAALLITGIAAIPSVFAATSPQQAYQNCKNEAEAEEVESANMQTYIRGCMKENGVDAAAIDGVFNEMDPQPENSGKKDSGDAG